MSPSERFTNPSSKSDSGKTAVLPTKNSPGDSANNQKQGSEARRDQRENASKSKHASASRSSKDGSAFKSPNGKSSNADDKR